MGFFLCKEFHKVGAALLKALSPLYIGIVMGAGD